jgi:hypothetical protein
MPSSRELLCFSTRSFQAKKGICRELLALYTRHPGDTTKTTGEFKLKKIRRQDNALAHELAKHSCVRGSGGMLRGAIPPCVLESALPICNQNPYL